MLGSVSEPSAAAVSQICSPAAYICDADKATLCVKKGREAGGGGGGGGG